EEHGYLVWEVDFGAQTALIDAGNAKVLQTKTDNRDDNDPEDNLVGSIKLPAQDLSDAEEARLMQAKAKIDMAQAIAAAQKALGTSAGSASAELEEENGYLVWEVAIGNQVAIVDAGNAKVLQTRVDNDDQDDD